MKQMIYATTVFLIGLAGCSKKPPTENLPDPPPAAAFTRTVVYTNQNNAAYTASYSGNATVDARAQLENNEIRLGFFATPKVNNTTGDGIAFTIDKAYLQQGLVRTFHLDAQTAPAVVAVRYNHMWQKGDGGFWSSIHDTSMGLQMGGTLTITGYNAERKLLAGYFSLVIKDLISDPMRYDGPSTIDPLKQNTVTVTGTFSNVKLLQN